MKKLVDITPPKFRCSFEPSCPAVFRSDEGTYVIIGKTLNPTEHAALKGRVAFDETAIEISLELVNDAIGVSRMENKVKST